MENINIDFQIYDSKDPKYIIVLDTSTWGLIKDKPAIIEVVTPGFTKPWVQYYDKNAVNYITTKTTGLDCEGCCTELSDLPDGVYKITVKGSPEKFCYTRYYLKTTLVDAKLDELLVASYTDCDECNIDDDEISKVVMYKNLLEVANASVRRGEISRANKILQKVDKYVKRFKNCKGCPHNR